MWVRERQILFLSLLSRFFSFCISFFLSFSLSLSLFLFLSLSRSISSARSLSCSLALALALAHSLSLVRSLSRSFFSLSLSLSLSHSLSLSLFLSRLLSLCLSLSLPLCSNVQSIYASLIHRVLPCARFWVLQHTATHCNIPKHTVTYRNTLQHFATHCNIPQPTAPHRNKLQHTATHRCTLLHSAQIEFKESSRVLAALHCDPLQHTATHCHKLQQTVTHCNTLQKSNQKSTRMCSLLICYNLIWSVAIQSAGNCAVCWQVCAFRVVACREVLAWIVCWVRVCKFRHVGGNSRRCGWVVWRAWILSLLHEYALLHSMWKRVCVSKLCMSILCEFVTRTHMRTHASARVRLALSSTHTHTHAHSHTYTHTQRHLSIGRTNEPCDSSARFQHGAYVIYDVRVRVWMGGGVEQLMEMQMNRHADEKTGR